MITNCYGLDIDYRFLNTKIFANTTYFTIFCQLNSIQIDVFKQLVNLRVIIFDSVNLIKLIRKQGIEWIKNINSNLSVDISMREDLRKNRFFIFQIFFLNSRDFLLNSKSHYFYEEDFCLLADFPFKQLTTWCFLSPIQVQILKKWNTFLTISIKPHLVAANCGFFNSIVN